MQELEPCEYPADFLVARLLGKKGRFLCNWDILAGGSEPVEALQGSPFYSWLKKYGAAGIWRFLYNEHLWVYGRMNREFRNVFAPYFVYHEMSTIITCFRYLHTNSGTEIVSQQLHDSLLHGAIQKILAGNREFPAMLGELESHLCSMSRLFHGLAAQYETGGISTLETFCREKLFAWIFHGIRSPLLANFFRSVVDFHNCMALAKNLRWKVADPPSFISGGTLTQRSMMRAHELQDMVQLLKHLPVEDRAGAASSVVRLETALFGSISAHLKKWSFQRTMVGDILFYLWEQFRHARNISMILHTVRLDDENVFEGLVTP